MTYVVAFDGSDLSATALERAVEHAGHTGHDVVAVSVIPADFPYARDRGWVDAEDEAEFDPDTVVETLRERALAAASEAEFRGEVIDAYVGARSIAQALKETAHDLDADVVFIGSENAGRVVSPVSSVGSPLASDTEYDVYIVRDTE